MASFRQINARKQTAFRLAALANGYMPTPNVDKRTFTKGWNKAMYTAVDFQKWERKLSLQATGIRIDNGLCAIDVDIDDLELVDTIWERATARFPQLREALVRHGSGAKELWLCRTTEQFSVIFSTTHVRAGEDPEGEEPVGHRLEAFGGGHARQMGASGAHTMLPDNSGFAIEYLWEDDEGPAEVSADSLPLLTKDNVLAIAEIACKVLDENKWPRILRTRSGESSSAAVYDLTDDMRFDCLDNVQRTLAELEDYARQTNARCSGSWSGDANMVNRTRCLVSLDHDGYVSVLETASWTRHFAANLADRDVPITEVADALGDKLLAAGYTLDEEEYYDAPASFQDIVFDLLKNWAWDGTRSQSCLPIYRPENCAQTLQNLRGTYIAHSYMREGKNGGMKRINPVDAWYLHGQRENVDGYRFMPNKPVGIHATMGVRAINSYVAPVHALPDPPAICAAHVALWNDFMAHLIPDVTERTWFVDWLAHKKQNLTVPSVAVIMSTKSYGVGRGSLTELVECIFGRQYVNNISASNLLGTGGQAVYNDFMANALFVTVDEVLPNGDDGGAMEWRRKRAYEQLKERVDPRARQMNIVRKNLPNYQDMVYVTYLLNTNHENALPIPEDDRRIVVITNSRVPLMQRPELKARLDEMRNPDMDRGFIRSLADMLDARDVSHFNSQVAPPFVGKARMLASNISDLGDTVDDVLDNMPLDWATLDAVLNRVEALLTQRDLKDTYPKWRSSCTDMIREKWHIIGRMYVAGRDRKMYVLVREQVMEKAFRAMSTEDRAAQYKVISDTRAMPSARLHALRQGLREV